MFNHLKDNRYGVRIGATVLCLLLALLLGVSAASARDTGGGNQAGDGGRIKKVELIIFRKTPAFKIGTLMRAVQKNWNHRYKLTLPNSTPSINAAIIRLARNNPAIASDVVISLLRSNRKRTRKLLLKKIRELNQSIAFMQKRLKRVKDRIIKALVQRSIKSNEVSLERVKALRLTLRAKKSR